MAAAKIVGLVVTPTTEYSSTIDCRLPLCMRSRERSSSQTATPASDSSASFSFCAMTGAFRAGWVRTTTGSSVAGGVGETARGRDGAGRDGGAGAGRLQALPGSGHDRLVGEAELLVEDGVGGAGPVVGEADDPAGVADELAPAHGDAGLDAHPGADRRGEHLVLVGLVLVGEPLDARHGDDPGGDAVGLEPLAGGDRDLHLGAGAHEDHLGAAVRRVGQDVGAARHALGGAEGAPVEDR